MYPKQLQCHFEGKMSSNFTSSCNHNETAMQSVTIFIQLKSTEQLLLCIYSCLLHSYTLKIHTPNTSHKLHIKGIKIFSCVGQYKPRILETFTFWNTAPGLICCSWSEPSVAQALEHLVTEGQMLSLGSHTMWLAVKSMQKNTWHTSSDF